MRLTFWFIVLACSVVSVKVMGAVSAFADTRLTAFEGQIYNDFGCANAVSGDFSVVGAKGDFDNGMGAGAIYLFKHDGGNWVNHQKIYPENPSEGDQFGSDVDISDTFLIVGTPIAKRNGISNGSVYIFTKEADNWVPQTELYIEDGPSYAYFGTSVAISDNLAIVGAVGEELGVVYIYRFDGNAWLREARLENPNQTCLNCNGFGNTVAISGNYAVVGSENDNENGNRAGTVYIYAYQHNSWHLQQKLLDPNGGSDGAFGSSVAMDGDYVIVGASGYYEKAAFIFKRTGGSWELHSRLGPFTGEENLSTGKTVDIDGDFAIIGSMIYHRSGNDWFFTASLDVTGEVVPGSAAISDSQAMVGFRDFWSTSPSYYGVSIADIPATAPMIRVPISNQLQYVDFASYIVSDLNDVFLEPDERALTYTVESDGYTIPGVDGTRLRLDSVAGFIGVSKVMVTASNGIAETTCSFDVDVIPKNKIVSEDFLKDNQFGSAMAVHENFTIIGAPGDDVNGKESGAAYIFRREGEQWIQQSKLLPSGGSELKRFGTAVSICPEYAAVVEQGRWDLLNSALYIYRKVGDDWVEEAILLPDTETHNDCFGTFVSISDGYTIVSAQPKDVSSEDSLSVYVYKRTGETWNLQNRLIPDQTYGRTDRFGQSCLLENGRLFVHTAHLDESGSVIVQYEFEEVDGSWVLQTKLSSQVGAFITSESTVFTSGDRIIVGGPSSERVHIIQKSGSEQTSWSSITASDGVGGDHFGGSVLLAGNFAIIGAPYDDKNEGNSGSAYVFFYDGGHWYQQSKIMPVDAEANEHFGSCLAAHGNTVMINSHNAVYVYQLSENTPVIQTPIPIQVQHVGFDPFTLPDLNTVFKDPDGDPLSYSVESDGNTVATLTGSIPTIAPAPGFEGTGSLVSITATDGEHSTTLSVRIIILPTNMIFPDQQNLAFGVHVATSGTHAIIGATSSASIYVHNAITWEKETDITSMSGPLAVSILGDYAIVGSYSDRRATVFKREGKNWTPCSQLTPAEASDESNFGASVALSENFALVGQEVVGNHGRVHIFKKNGDTWPLHAFLEEDVDDSGVEYGYAVDLTDHYAIVGRGKTGGGPVSIYERCGDTWRRQTKLSPNDPYFGSSVGISGHYAIVGSGFESFCPSSARIFKRNGKTWNLQTLLSESPCKLVDIYGNYAISGNFYVDRFGFISGSAKIYKRTADTWRSMDDVIDYHSDIWLWTYGRSVAISESYVMTGALGGQRLTDEDFSVSSGLVFVSDPLSDLFFSESGPNQTVFEGTTVYLDGSASRGPSGSSLQFQWIQLEGSDVVLSDSLDSNPHFVTPPVKIDGEDLVFELLVTDENLRKDRTSVCITIRDNGIADFESDVISFKSAAGANIGIRIDNKGNLTRLKVLDPATLPVVHETVDTLPYELVEMDIHVPDKAETCRISFFLPEPAPEGAELHVFSSDGTSVPFNGDLQFREDRKALTFSLNDGGTYDSDGIQNNSITSIIGIHAKEAEDVEETTDQDDGGQQGCFIGVLY